MKKLQGTIIVAIAMLALSSTTVLAQSATNYSDLISESDAGTYEIKGAMTIDHVMAKRFLDLGHVFVDARRSDQYRSAHIPGAISLDVNSRLTEESLAAVAEKDQCIVFYCSDVGCYRSANASAKAISWGYTNVAYFAEGWSSWNAEGYPTE